MDNGCKSSLADIDRYLDRLKRLYPPHPRYLLALLEDIQARYGYIPKDKILTKVSRYFHVRLPAVEQWLEVDEVFRCQAPASHALRICCGPVCSGRGGRQLLDQMRGQLGSLPDKIGLLASPCLGRCGEPPVAKLDGQCFAAADAAGLLKSVRDIMGAGDDS